MNTISCLEYNRDTFLRIIEYRFLPFSKEMSIWQAIGLTVLPNIGGILGSVLTKKNIKTWYEVKIDRPSWRPPNW